MRHRPTRVTLTVQHHGGHQRARAPPPADAPSVLDARALTRKVRTADAGRVLLLPHVLQRPPEGAEVVGASVGAVLEQMWGVVKGGRGTRTSHPQVVEVAAGTVAAVGVSLK